MSISIGFTYWHQAYLLCLKIKDFIPFENMISFRGFIAKSSISQVFQFCLLNRLYGKKNEFQQWFLSWFRFVLPRLISNVGLENFWQEKENGGGGDQGFWCCSKLSRNLLRSLTLIYLQRYFDNFFKVYNCYKMHIKLNLFRF